MLLFGHPLIPSQKFYHISSQEQIVHTPPSSTLYLEFEDESIDLINYLRHNDIEFALSISTITDAILAHNLGARYIVVPKEIVKSIQNIAENYLFDAKILVHSQDHTEIEEYALLGIDGILFYEAIVKVT